jgi:hypothetical protein
VEADEVVDGADGVEEREVDAHEHQQPRHRARSVRHLALTPSLLALRRAKTTRQTAGSPRKGAVNGSRTGPADEAAAERGRSWRWGWAPSHGGARRAGQSDRG